MNKYGLNLRPAKPKKQPPRPSIALGFNEDDDNDVEKEIAIQASKSKSLKEVRKPYILIWWLLLCCICLYRLWSNFPFFFSIPFLRLRSSKEKPWKKIRPYLIMTESMIKWKRKLLVHWYKIAKRERYGCSFYNFLKISIKQHCILFSSVENHNGKSMPSFIIIMGYNLCNMKVHIHMLTWRILVKLTVSFFVLLFCFLLI